MYFSFSIITAQPSKSVTNTVSNVVSVVVAPIFEAKYVLGKAFPGKGKLRKKGLFKIYIKIKRNNTVFLRSVVFLGNRRKEKFPQKPTFG